jgi:hypothetical protein
MMIGRVLFKLYSNIHEQIISLLTSTKYQINSKFLFIIFAFICGAFWRLAKLLLYFVVFKNPPRNWASKGYPLGARSGACGYPEAGTRWASFGYHPCLTNGHPIPVTWPVLGTFWSRPTLTAPHPGPPSPGRCWPPPPHGRYTGRRPKLASLFSSRRTRWPLLSGRRLLHGHYAGRSYPIALPAVEKSGRTAGGRRNTYMTEDHSHIGCFCYPSIGN